MMRARAHAHGGAGAQLVPLRGILVLTFMVVVSGGCDRSQARAVHACRSAIVRLLVNPSSARFETPVARACGAGWEVSLSVTSKDGSGRDESQRVMCEMGADFSILDIREP